MERGSTPILDPLDPRLSDSKSTAAGHNPCGDPRKVGPKKTSAEAVFYRAGRSDTDRFGQYKGFGNFAF